jgi:hypothetical protein
MSQGGVQAIVEFLSAKAAEVRRLEARADQAIHQDKDQARYEAVMREKAALLAGLARDASGLLDGLDEPLAGEVAERLAAFSASAQQALRLGSVFYMWALLYPEDYTEGRKNDLEALIARIAGQG